MFPQALRALGLFVVFFPSSLFHSILLSKAMEQKSKWVTLEMPYKSPYFVPTVKLTTFQPFWKVVKSGRM